MSAARQLVTIEAPGDALSPSSAATYLSCSAKWYYRKIAKIPDPPTGALTLGSALHAALGENFLQKLDTHEDLAAAGVQAIYNEAWALMVRGEYPGRHGREPSLPTEFRDDEDAPALKAMGLALTLKYLGEAAPKIQPVAVELPVAGKIAGVTVRGYIDLLEEAGDVVDIKTAAKKPTEISSDYRMQIATYAQLSDHTSGRARVDTLVKTKTPQLIQLTAQVEQPDIDATAKMYPLIQRHIRAGVWLPNRQSYMCSRKYCSAWRNCQADFGGTVAL